MTRENVLSHGSNMRHAAKHFALLILRGYQYLISPWLGAACRYQPTCSHYAIHAIEMHGVFRGCIIAMGRVLRCHPFSVGGYDPVRPRSGAGFRPISTTTH